MNFSSFALLILNLVINALEKKSPAPPLPYGCYVPGPQPPPGSKPKPKHQPPPEPEPRLARLLSGAFPAQDDPITMLPLRATILTDPQSQGPLVIRLDFTNPAAPCALEQTDRIGGEWTPLNTWDAGTPVPESVYFLAAPWIPQTYLRLRQLPQEFSRPEPPNEP